MKFQKQLTAAFLAFCLTASLCACTSERGVSNTAETEEASSAAETEAAETEETTDTTAETTTTETETTTTLATETTAPQNNAIPAVNNIALTHITEGGEGLGVFHVQSGNIRGEVMQEGSLYKNWKLVRAYGYSEENDTVKEAAADFEYAETAGFAVNGTVEVLPADDPDYPNKMYFHSDDVDAFPKYMNDNRGEVHKAKFIIENSGDVYKMLDKDDPPAETSFAVSVTVSKVTVRYAADGTAYDTITVTAASNR